MTVERSGLDENRQVIREEILSMGEKAGRALLEVIEALDHLDPERARAIIDADKDFNQCNESIHEECLTLIARQQPMASDLREIVSGLQVAVELERIADHVADIARIAQKLKPEAIPPLWDEIRRIAEHCNEMLAKMMGAFQDRDPVQARVIASRDDEIDRMHDLVTGNTIEFMQTHSNAVINGTRVIWITHHLERIGDRITNIGEHILFAISGETEDWNRS
ncbi:MAG TPA: phosphate signaling complex protein PhoU [Gammaproteobacteria bacterium]|nr:phosphate signaling complex protein PhoU [Gammaproteobacteria bacterium]